MNWLDLVIAGLLAFSAWRGYRRGFIRGGCEVGGTLIGLVAAYAQAVPVGDQVAGILGLPAVVGRIAVALVIVLGAAAIGDILGNAWARASKSPALQRGDQLGGLAFGVAQGLFLTAIGLVLLMQTPSEWTTLTLERSWFSRWIVYAAPSFYQAVAGLVPPQLR